MERNKILKYSIVIILFLLLILVRILGKIVFNDPLIAFFNQADYSLHPFPKVDSTLYFFQLSIRYTINALVSLAIIHFLFRKKDLIKLSGLIFLVILPLAGTILAIQINSNPINYTLLLFARRILMHPILLLILLPAFYFQQRRLTSEGEKL